MGLNTLTLDIIAKGGRRGRSRGGDGGDIDVLIYFSRSDY